MAMNVGEDTVGIGYASMDQAFRILLGKPTVDERTPIRIWDKTNVNEAGHAACGRQGLRERAVGRLPQALGPARSVLTRPSEETHAWLVTGRCWTPAD